jgi:ribosomal protein S18 acetylase RimI-like enzyme
MNTTLVKRLDWDSLFFEREIGFCNALGKDDNFNFPSGFDLIYLFSDMELLHNDLPECIDKKIVFTKETVKGNDNASRVEIYNGALNQELIELSIQSGVYSRFKLDKKLSSYFERLYTLWIKNSIESDFADYILVYRLKNKIIGFLTLKENENFFQIGLISVSEKHRGKGIGTALLNKVDLIVGANKEVRVVTQLDNKSACNLYSKNGYSQSSLTYIYHLWQ